MNLINLVRMEREEAMSSECRSFGLKRDMVIWVCLVKRKRNW